MELKRAVVTLSVAGVLLSGAAQAVPRYSVTYLGTLGGAEHSYANAINARGQVVGEVASPLVAVLPARPSFTAAAA